MGTGLQNRFHHYFSTSQCWWELKLLETSHFAVAASLNGFKVTMGERAEPLRR